MGSHIFSIDDHHTSVRNQAESDSQPLTALEDEITTLCAHLGAAEHRLLTAIGEFDARSGWVGLGIASCAHWLSWKCGISLSAGHEKVRIARALRTLPELSAAMSRGELSYSKVRALTRVATPANESSLVRLGRQGTASQIEEIVRRYRRVQRLAEAAEAAAIQRSREVRYRWDEDGTFILNARLPPEQGALVLKALEAATDAIREAARVEAHAQSSAEDSGLEPTAVPADQSSAEDSPRSERQPGIPAESFSARRADALVLMAETVLAHGPANLSGPDRSQVVLHVDAAALAGATQDAQCELEHGPALAVETARRLLCDSSIVTVAEDPDGNPLNVGRKTRSIPTALRRALNCRDKGCRFPACTNRRFTDAHHIEHWADGGETKLQNLVLLCGVHHRLVHEEGFSVEQTPIGLVFRTPDGRRVEDVPASRVLKHDPVLALMALHAERGITARTSIPEWRGEVPAYDWITDALWRRDHRAGTNAVARDSPC
jgi:hypothetical protein